MVNTGLTSERHHIERIGREIDDRSAGDAHLGKEKFGGPIDIGGSVPGSGDGSVDERVSFNSLEQLQRPALLLSNGVVYVAFASYPDNDPSHGWVFADGARTVNQLAVFSTTPHRGEA